MKKIIMKIFTMLIIFCIAFPFNVVMAGNAAGSGYGTLVEVTGDVQTEKPLSVSNLKVTDDPFMRVVSDFLITIGDYAHDYLSKIFKEEITIDRIVYNKSLMLNANFFEDSTNSAMSSAAGIVRTTINKWFGMFQKISLVVILMAFIGAGIKMMVGTASGKASAYESFKKILFAIMLIYLFPYVMKYAFEINEGIVQMIHSKIYKVDNAIGVAILPVSDLVKEKLEFRSPQYVSTASLRVSVAAGSSEATQLYINKIQQKASQGDVMRIMRAFAGATLQLIYVIIWYILLVQLYILVFMYVKRFIVIAFLIAVYPVVVIGYVTGNIFGESHDAFNKWCNKFFTNVFIQSLHAVIYGVISSVLIDQVRKEMVETGVQKVNGFLMIVATSFLFSGEKILSAFWKASIDTSERGEMKKLLGKAGKKVGSFFSK